MRTDNQALVDELHELVRNPSREAAAELMQRVRPEDVAEAFQRIESNEVVAILQLLDVDVAANILIETSAEVARASINELPDAIVAQYLDVLPMDDAVEVREWLDRDRFESLMKRIPQEDAEEIRRLLSYPDDSAGRLMSEAFVSVGPDDTVEQVIDHLRATAEEAYETVNYIYVLDEHVHLLGVVSLRKIVRAPADALVKDLMREDVLHVAVTDTQEDVARRIARYGLSAVPVLDSRGRMVGIVTADDAQDVIQEADTEDVLKMGAVGGDAEPYLSLSVTQLVKRRVPWLLALFLAESLTGNVLRYYGQGGGGDEVRLNPLAFFIPLLIGAGGNSGSQVTTTITRALALDELVTRDWWRVIRKEFLTALISGGILGLVGFIRAWAPIPIIGWGSQLDISLVVGLALPAIVIWSTSIGSLLPIGAKRLGVDPAVMSAPFISTFVDATGLVIYFEIAKRLLHHGI